MAAIDFPASPTNGQQFTAASGVTYIWLATPGIWYQTASPIAFVGVIGSAHAEYTTFAQIITPYIPVDNTIPQNTEGTQIISLPYTIRQAGSKLRCRFHGIALLDATIWFIAALFKDSDVNAFAAQAGSAAAGTSFGSISLGMEKDLVHGAAVGVVVTIKVRIAANAGSIYVNGNNAPTQLFGGASLGQTLTIEEVV